jgi:hypothetical protein
MAIAPNLISCYNLSTVAAENKVAENYWIIHSIFDALQHNNKLTDNGDSKTSIGPPTKTPVEAIEQASHD